MDWRQTSEKSGNAYPLGATKMQGGWNFAIYSTTPLSHFMVAPIEDSSSITFFNLSKKKNSTGQIWHTFIETKNESLYYSWKEKESSLFIIDPYAKVIDTNNSFNNNFWKKIGDKNRLYTIASANDHYDWQDTYSPHLKSEELIIYEMHIRGFTKHKSSNCEAPGTLKAAIQKIPYLKELGVTAVELLPVLEWNESEYIRKNPVTGESLVNYWGYSPLSFFSPMQRFSSKSDPFGATTELKDFIRACHKEKIEVILDVVYNHTGEGNEQGPSYSMKLLAKNEYYLISDAGHYLNYTGCGNTINCNNPLVQDLIIASLRYYATEFRVDGFRFDLASILTRSQSGEPLETAPLLERITQDSVLKECKLIAEPWDAVGLHQVGRFFNNYSKKGTIWCEWNDNFRSIVRRFIKGDNNLTGSFATKLCGSSDIYGAGGSPLNSINFVISHDGFSLNDLVTYNQKHNLENGENDADGMNNNDSWNCGTEGETTDLSILHLREKQIKNFFVANLLSFGIPMLFMGDEYGHTKMGNNNSWCQDNDLNHFNWDELQNQKSLLRFVKGVIHFRKKSAIWKKTTFLTTEDITWHGRKPNLPEWGPGSKLVAYTLHENILNEEVFIAYNASSLGIEITLPPPSHNKAWGIHIQTAVASPDDYIEKERVKKITGAKITVASNSALVLVSM